MYFYVRRKLKTEVGRPARLLQASKRKQHMTKGKAIFKIFISPCPIKVVISRVEYNLGISLARALLNYTMSDKQFWPNK